MKNYIENLALGASEVIVANARALRARMTPAEKLLWMNLRNRKLGGFKFRRQHPVDKFIADFYCHEKRVVIEVDGGIHLNIDQLEYDRNRTVVLNNWGIEVMRFTNEEVLFSMSKVLRCIKEFCENR